MLVQELAAGVEIHAFSPQSNIYTERPKGIYLVERGIVAIEGHLLLSGMFFGMDCLRAGVKKTNGRALTFVTAYIIPMDHLKSIVEKYPPIQKFANKWNAWAALRSYVHTYTRLYMDLAINGTKEDGTPLVPRRGKMLPEENDEIDEIVEEQVKTFGF